MLTLRVCRVCCFFAAVGDSGVVSALRARLFALLLPAADAHMIICYAEPLHNLQAGMQSSQESSFLK